jgi:hypothetical protein
VYWRRPASKKPPDTSVARAACCAICGIVIPSAAALSRSSAMLTSSGGPPLTWIPATPGTASMRGTTRSWIRRLKSSIEPFVPGSFCTKNHDRVWFDSCPLSCTTGGFTSGGSCGMRLSRPITSTSIARMSVPTAKVRLTKLPPCPALPSICCRPGRPCSTFSIGSRISDSISCGEAARQPVCTDICGRSMSGNSCSGSWRRLNQPNRQTIATTTATAAGFLSEPSVSFMFSSGATAGALCACGCAFRCAGSHPGFLPCDEWNPDRGQACDA